ncbi:MAG: large conductance mechanosensitive channel protein MscL [Chloroflexi bacterium]|nr:MAG: large conductance mechanosensitive channel protein MscL [Chloroflexota bacterium]TMD54322.1 MAG: large conductance mechanosensitive channel protein MscL [Chloroflexota bacterium]
MLREFKQFLLRGNVVDLAVGIVIGGAFNVVVMALVKDFITPLVGAIFSVPKDAMRFRVGAATFLVGDFLDALISFLIVAAVVFFLVVKPVNYLVERSHREDTPDPTTRKCPECLSEIPVGARRCAFCTSQVSAAA